MAPFSLIATLKADGTTDTYDYLYGKEPEPLYPYKLPDAFNAEATKRLHRVQLGKEEPWW